MILKSDVKAIKKKIDYYNIISFDVFDTLLCRKTSIKKVFFEVKKRSEREGIYISDFYKRRCEAEEKARKLSEYGEVTIEEIYQQFIGINDKQKQVLCNIEQEVEFQVMQIHEIGKELYDYAMMKEKKIIIVSDMYLPIEFIESVLKKNGYYGYSRLYVSSNERVKKRSGKLFKVVGAQYDIKQMIHIGDNPISDWLYSRLNGITSMLL